MSSEWIEKLQESDGVYTLDQMMQDIKSPAYRGFRSKIPEMFRAGVLTYKDLQTIANVTKQSVVFEEAQATPQAPAVPPPPVVLDGGIMSDPLGIILTILTAGGGMIAAEAAAARAAKKGIAVGDLGSKIATKTIAGTTVVTGSHHLVKSNVLERLEKIAKSKGAKYGEKLIEGAIPTGVTLVGLNELKKKYPELIGYVDDQLATFQKNIESMVQPTLDRIDSLVAVLNAVPWLEIAETWRLMKPAVYDLNNEVLRPYLDAVKAGKDFLPAYQDMLKQAGNHVDSPLGYTPPNLDAEKMAGIVQALNLPVIGSIYRGMLQVMLVQQYQAQHGRGYRTELDALAACAGVSNQPVMSPGDVADAVDIPKWILQ